MKCFKHSLIEELQRDIEIPDCVQQKAEEAFRMVRQERFVKRQDGAGKRISVRKICAAAAVMFIMGTVTVGVAAFAHWSHFLEEDLKVTNEQKKELEDNKITAAINKTATAQGITVTAIQTLINDHYANIVFKVEGYELQEGKEPAFESVKISLDGEELSFAAGEAVTGETAAGNIQASGVFYNGLVSTDYGKAVYADGTPGPLAGDLEQKFIREDGSMEYVLVLMNTEKRGCFNGRQIQIELNNMGTIEETKYQQDIKATWNFDWTLEGSDIVRTCEMKETLGDSGAVIVKAEVTPISLCAFYELEEKGIEPPELAGVKLKDGTMYPVMYKGPGVKKYTNADRKKYVRTFAIDRILDVDEVESLLFVKSYPEDMETYTEDNFYIVPLK